MIGFPYNPDNCVILSNQVLNANQFNSNVPDASNNDPHIFLWDFVENKFYWVNSKTNIIERELAGAGEPSPVSKRLELLFTGPGLGDPTGNIINNTTGATITFSRYGELAIGEYLITSDLPIFANESDFMVAQGTKNSFLLYEIGQTQIEGPKNTIKKVWGWNTVDDYSIVIFSLNYTGAIFPWANQDFLVNQPINIIFK